LLWDISLFHHIFVFSRLRQSWVQRLPSMTSPDPDQWTIVDHTNNMASTQPIPASESTIELPINNKPASTTEPKAAECTCNPIPTLNRGDTKDTATSFFDDEDEFIPRVSRGRRRGGPRRFSPSPIRGEEFVRIPSSAKLLNQVAKYDGVAELPDPARTSVYLTTFPFTDRDVKKYAWLFANGVEEHYFSEPVYDPDHEDHSAYPAIMVSNRRNRSPYYDPVDRNSIPSLFLSRALDTNVIPENTGDKQIRYWIVVQNKARPQGSKLLIAESRKAAGIMIYYEALTGNSVLFVGAVVHQCGKPRKNMKIKRVESLDEAISVQEEGFVGIIC
jgi:hypothetical protein